MDFQAPYTTNSMITQLSCTIVSSYQQGQVIYYNVTATDTGGKNYTAVMTRGYRGEFILQNVVQVT